MALTSPPSQHGFFSFFARPAAIFALLSLVFGAATIAVTPPLRGPDETAHFVRAYGYAHGQIIPRLTDKEGRKGMLLPARLAADLAFFNAFRHGAGDKGSFRQVFAEYARGRDVRFAATGGQPVFWLYEGAEGYSPIPYLPAIVAAGVGDIAGLDFIAMLYLMRLAGLLAYTAIAAYAIARLPCGAWAFLCIAMLPSSIYGRAVVSADGAALVSALVVTALALHAAVGSASGSGRRSLWTAYCALTKPPQIAFVLLEAMVRPWRDLPRHWRAVALVILPAAILCPLWIVAVGADIASWRLHGEGWAPPEQFDPVWKLRYLLAHPLQFFAAVRVSLDYTPELWKQAIGVFGWLDTRLAAWAYPVLGLLLIAALLQRLPADAPRLRIGVTAGLTALGYAVTVFLVFYLTSTPVHSPRVEGVQGRYFTVALAPAAMAVAALLPRAPPGRLIAGVALAGALLSGVALLEAVLRTDWLRP